MEKKIDEYNRNTLNLFILKVNSNEFNYSLLEENLIDPMIDYSISRQVKKQYKDKPGILSRKARQKFLDYTKNNGELGELLLFCFLETHLNAPKILTKLELKTSTSHYVNGADGVHFLKLENGNFQLIFGESKMYKDLTSGISDAFKSIYQFKNEINDNGVKKSGINYEKSLLSDNLLKETFDEEEKEFIRDLIYPKRENNFEIDDAFGVFIGFEISIEEKEKFLPNDKFREMIRERVVEEVNSRMEHIRKKIVEFKLQGHNFYFYIIPFTNIDEVRKKIIEGVVK
ncbi:DUF1837 domain-containing protein [Clostridium paraputrificum]|nr:MULTISPECIES: DUF1837 domain-containing protein [Clostridium]MDB2089207.1 DUF1837 domain-containing protein [Clostridium paraputrificum]MDB2095665.1 DUF1837 domain-containing protein [Clostridium paraputrificum]MDU1180802.1 DUF1837 domain-containing protein [Clostridium sp.]